MSDLDNPEKPKVPQPAKRQWVARFQRFFPNPLREPESYEISEFSPAGVTRRDVLKGAAAVGGMVLAGALPTPSVTADESESASTPDQFEVEDGLDTTNVRTLFSAVRELDAGNDRTIVIESLLNQLEAMYAPRINRIRQLVELTYRTKNKDGEPKLIALYGQLLGAMNGKYLIPEDVIPFFKEKKTISAAIKSLEEQLALLKAKREQDSSGSEDEEYDEINKIIQTELGGFLMYPPDSLGQCFGEMTIVPGNNGIFSPEGQKKFDEDRSKIKTWLDRAPAFQRLCNKIVLFSTKYHQKSSQNEGVSFGGEFSTFKDPDKKVPVGEVFVNMDHADPGDTPVELTFLHEVYGHGGSVLKNQNLANDLSAEDYFNRLVFEMEVLSDPKWGDRDGTIPEIFSRLPNFLKSDLTLLTASTPVSVEQFEGMIRQYPRNEIVQRNVINEVIGSPQENSLTGNQRLPGARLENANYYQNLGDFMTDYLPILRKSAQQGNIRSQVILWGLEHLPQELANYEFLWFYDLPIDVQYAPYNWNKTGVIWSNYCNKIVLNAVVYHAFINGVEQVCELFNPQEQQLLASKALEVRAHARNELYAEGESFSAFLGSRMVETTIYKKSFDQLSDLLLK